QAEFAYAAISADVPGLAGIQNFLELERGYCTYFAAGTTLLLRALGLPARVATGFLVDEWDDEAGAFVVTTQNGHAWTEVWFEGLGWLRVDSTPGERRLRALGRLGEGPSGLGEWASTFGKDLGFVLRSGARSSDVAVLGETVKTLPVALSRSAKKQPWLFGGFVVALSTWTAWRMRRGGRGRDRNSARKGPKSAPLELEERFRAVLVERGAPRLASATLREQSKSAGVGQEIAEALGRLRYGGGSAQEHLLEQVREGIAALEQEPETAA
ncbi:MAG: transglutaminase-like domain-containing protein, partial [Planctomycetota bacterium]